MYHSESCVSTFVCWNPRIWMSQERKWRAADRDVSWNWHLHNLIPMKSSNRRHESAGSDVKSNANSDGKMRGEGKTTMIRTLPCLLLNPTITTSTRYILRIPISYRYLSTTLPKMSSGDKKDQVLTAYKVMFPFLGLSLTDR